MGEIIIGAIGANLAIWIESCLMKSGVRPAREWDINQIVEMTYRAPKQSSLMLKACARLAGSTVG